MSSPKDKLDLEINPITGKPDVVRKFNPDRIITNKLNAAGNPRKIWDPVTNSFIDDGASIVIDNQGRVVTT